MRISTVLALLAGSVAVLSSFADGPKYAYVGGECVDAGGKPGLNPKYVGDCGDLHAMNLDKKDLSSQSLRGANLKDASLKGAILDGTNLERADLSGAQLQGASALKGTNLGSARMEGANWDDATIADASLIGARASDASFRGAALANDQFGNSELARARFDGAKLEGDVFTNALLYDAVFSDAVFKSGNFASADLSFAIFSRADVSGVDFTAVNAVQPGFGAAKGAAPIFASATFRQANFAGSAFDAPEMSGAQFIESALDGAIWKHAKLLQALLRASTLREGNFDEADLRMARIEDCAFDATSFQKADFRTARMQPTGWDQTKLKGAKINSRTHHPFSAAEIARAGIVIIGRSGEAGILYDNTYVDAGAGSDAEATNLQNFLKLEVTHPTKVYDPAKIQLELDDVGTYLIPELEHSAIPLGGAEVAAFRTFLADGGNLVLFNSARIVLEKLLGAPLTEDSSDHWMIDPDVAAKLGLRTSVTSLKDYSDTNSFARSSLPKGTQVIFGDADTAAVFVVPVGKGRIWYLGWDFYDFPNLKDGIDSWGALLKAVMDVSLSGGG